MYHTSLHNTPQAQKLSQDEVDEIIFGALSGDGFWNHLGEIRHRKPSPC